MFVRSSLSAPQRTARAISAAIVVLVGVAASPVLAQSAAAPDHFIQVAREVRDASFPELAGVRVSYHVLHSTTDFFRSRPGLSGYVVSISDNPVLATAPAEAVRAILAHEFEHICWYRFTPKWRLVGLLRLMWTAGQSRWERDTDRRTVPGVAKVGRQS